MQNLKPCNISKKMREIIHNLGLGKDFSRYNTKSTIHKKFKNWTS